MSSRSIVFPERATSYVCGAVVVSLIVFGQIFSGAQAASLLALTILVVLGVAMLALIPVEWLPSVALLVYAVIPDRLLPNSSIIGAVPIPTLLMLGWVVRKRARVSATDRSGPKCVRWIAILLACWSLLEGVIHRSSFFGWGWVASFGVGLLIVVCMPDAKRESLLALKAWVLIGGVAGVYAIVEGALGRSPVFGTLYRLLGVESSQHWSTYRAEVGFSHPLNAGLFLAVAAIFGIVGWLRMGKRSWLLSGLLSTGGVLATVSRGSIIAEFAALAVVALLLVAVKGRATFGRSFLLVVGSGLALFIVSTSSVIAQRSSSLEGGRSAAARDFGFGVALRAAEHVGVWGSGPATSGASAEAFGDVVIENSYLQLLISIGLPGLVLFLLLVLGVAAVAFRRNSLIGLGGFVCMLVAIGGYNAIDAVRSTHFLLGLVALIALNTTDLDLSEESRPTTPIAKPDLVVNRSNSA